MCPCGAGRSPTGSWGVGGYISAWAGGITVVYWMAVSSLLVELPKKKQITFRTRRKLKN